MGHFPVRAARGTALSARGWPQEAALRMLANSLDPEVAEHPESLVVHAGGKAARSPGAYEALARCLTELGGEETLLVQSGKPVGVLRTHEWAPRVLLANANLVPEWANGTEFRRLEELGLIAPGRTASGSWMHIGHQGVLQNTYQTFSAVAARRFGGTLAGTITLTAGLGGMGAAQLPAVTMNDGVVICVECDPARIARSVGRGDCDHETASAAEALALALQARDAQRPLAVALRGNAAEVLPQLLAAGAPLDIVTDQTPAHDPLRYLPAGVPFEEQAALRERDPEGLAQRARASMARHVEAMVGFQEAGAEVFDYGNSLRAEARTAGYEHAFAYPGFVSAYLRPLFCEGKGPFRWVALSGDARDIDVTDRAVLELFPDDHALTRWIRTAREKVRFQGLPARVCWLGQGERDRAGLRFNELVARGELGAPVVIGRDHLDGGSVASPHGETEGMLDGSDAVADWPLLNALLTTASGATWVAIHQGGAAGVGGCVHAGQAAVADGSPLAARKLERVLTNDPGIGVLRHADAGYERAVETAERHGLPVPMEPPEPRGAREAEE